MQKSLANGGFLQEDVAKPSIQRPSGQGRSRPVDWGIWTTALSQIRPLALGLSSSWSGWPLVVWERPLSFRGLVAAIDPLPPLATAQTQRQV